MKKRTLPLAMYSCPLSVLLKLYFAITRLTVSHCLSMQEILVVSSRNARAEKNSIASHERLPCAIILVLCLY